MRKKIKKPATDRAIQNIINKLIKFEERMVGYANQCLNQSITNCWQDVYEPKQDKQHSQYLSNHEKNMIQLERFLKETNDEQEQDESIMTVVNNWSK